MQAEQLRELLRETQSNSVIPDSSLSTYATLLGKWTKSVESLLGDATGWTLEPSHFDRLLKEAARCRKP